MTTLKCALHSNSASSFVSQLRKAKGNGVNNLNISP